LSSPLAFDVSTSQKPFALASCTLLATVADLFAIGVESLWTSPTPYFGFDVVIGRKFAHYAAAAVIMHTMLLSRHHAHYAAAAVIIKAVLLPPSSCILCCCLRHHAHYAAAAIIMHTMLLSPSSCWRCCSSVSTV
jgi:hypothetical protein